jgi:RNA polymerase sigma-70 factor (ECF subfamily)
LKPEPESATDESRSADPSPAGSGKPFDPDVECVRRSQAGDRDAMEILVRRHQAAVARLLWRFVRTPADLDDLVQETFMRMTRGLPTWRSDSPFTHWLLRIAANTGRDYCRRQSVRRRWTVEPRALDGEDPGDVVLPDAIDPGADPAARAAANEVKRFLEQLPPDDRALLTLQHLEGWNLKEIAGQFGWTVTATKIRAWRARNRLRALFETNQSS